METLQLLNFCVGKRPFRDMEEKSSNYMGGKDKPNSGAPLCN
ncbi:hypothetical protein [Olivibacter domesticus]|uniref:Uncharacterized protein n=1 Tax=Olivibacter domesticus TaxID=407022 RepID=A0A1H7WS22_OLID1|nr:hypothetical protein [Olivibacter domesticus]SEM23729.1 hypothetical protein SAMN05661044_04615 [Olivibacter domesticus]